MNEKSFEKARLPWGRIGLAALGFAALTGVIVFTDQSNSVNATNSRPTYLGADDCPIYHDEGRPVDPLKLVSGLEGLRDDIQEDFESSGLPEQNPDLKNMPEQRSDQSDDEYLHDIAAWVVYEDYRAGMLDNPGRLVCKEYGGDVVTTSYTNAVIDMLGYAGYELNPVTGTVDRPGQS